MFLVCILVVWGLLTERFDGGNWKCAGSRDKRLEQSWNVLQYGFFKALTVTVLQHTYLTSKELLLSVIFTNQ